jgi:hypothetical protein
MSMSAVNFATSVGGYAEAPGPDAPAAVTP